MKRDRRLKAFRARGMPIVAVFFSAYTARRKFTWRLGKSEDFDSFLLKAPNRSFF